MTGRTSAIWQRLRYGAVAAVAALPLAGIVLAAGSASAATNPPTLDKSASATGKSPSVAVTTSATERWIVGVSADGPSAAAQGATVKVGTTTCTVKSQSTYTVGNGVPGYAGAFDCGSVSAGTKTVSATLTTGKTTYNVLLQVLTYQGSGGVGDAEAGPLDGTSGNGCPSNPYDSVDSNSLVVAFGHDYFQAATPTAWTGNPPQAIGNYYLDPNGDTGWYEYLNRATLTASELGSLGLSATCGGLYQMAGLEIKGT